MNYLKNNKVFSQMLYEKYKDDLEALQFIATCCNYTSYSDAEIEDLIVRIREHRPLQEVTGILFRIYH